MPKSKEEILKFWFDNTFGQAPPVMNPEEDADERIKKEHADLVALEGSQQKALDAKNTYGRERKNVNQAVGLAGNLGTGLGGRRRTRRHRRKRTRRSRSRKA